MKHKFSISISIQISIFLIIVAFIPVAIMMALNTYEKQQLTMLENSNVQQGRIIAAALCNFENQETLSSQANIILKNMNGRFDSRIRILDKNGNLLADSSTIEKEQNQIAENIENSNYSSNQRNEKANADESFVYKLFSYPIRVYRRYFSSPRYSYDTADYYTNKTVFDGEEIISALNGRYGASTRFSSGGQVSVTLYSAIPIQNLDVDSQNVTGVVLVSRSTYKILQNLYELRLDLGKIFLRSLIVVLLISLFLSFRISYPLKKLSKQTVDCADKKGRIFFTDFTGKNRHDEIGELSRSFSQLINRLNNRIKFSQAFSSDISHEFKNPLTAIRTSAELLAETEQNLSDSEKKEFSKVIIEEVNHLQELLSGVRNISKIDAGIENENEDILPLPINTFTKNLIKRLQKNYPDKSVDFDSNKEEINIKLSQNYFDILAQNLIDNALSFGSKVLVKTQLLETDKNQKQRVLFSVEDNGRGVSEEQFKKIFERFYSERDDSQNKSHTGLGLSLVKAIIDSLEGEIFVTKSDVLGGAKFSLLIPIE